MRGIHLLILVALLHDIAGFHQITLPPQHDGVTSYITLNVCHASSSLTAGEDETLYLTGSKGTILPDQSIGQCMVITPSFLELFLVFREERPPKA